MIKKITTFDRDMVENFFINNWGSGEMVISSGSYQCELLDGFMYLKENQLVGLITFVVNDFAVEIISLDSLIESKGIGSQLLRKVEAYAIENEINEIKLITTNDNLKALSFYQKLGYRITAVYKDAVNIARQSKASIPYISDDNIFIQDELQLSKKLCRTDIHHWEAMELSQLINIMDNAKVQYGIAGGYGIELFCNKMIRDHNDIDVYVLDKDIRSLMRFLMEHGYRLYKAYQGVLTPLYMSDIITDDFSIWVSNGEDTPFLFEILIGRTQDDYWLYRRNLEIKLPIDNVFISKNGVSILNPLIILLFKMNKSNVEEKDWIDFEAVKPLLSEGELEWLKHRF